METFETFNFKQSILSAGGNPKACEYISKEDLDILVKKAINIKNRRDKFPSFDVVPVNSLEKGIEMCNFKKVDESFFEGLEISKDDLKPKKIILASFSEYESIVNDKGILYGGLNKIFKDYKLKLVENPVQYLLGLMILDIKNHQVESACRDFYLNDYEANKLLSIMLYADLWDKDFYSIGVKIICNKEKGSDWKELSSWMNVSGIQRDNFYMLEEDI